MYSTDVMMKEHENIIRMLNVIQTTCREVMEKKSGAAWNGRVNTELFRSYIDFIRNYADTYHHGKEERFLFPEMVKAGGAAAEQLVTHGMLVEHDQGRYFNRSLEESCRLYDEKLSGQTSEKNIGGADLTELLNIKLDIVTYAMSYVHLLQVHAKKENAVVYTFAERILNDQTKKNIDDSCKEYGERAESGRTREKYLGMLEKWENIFMV